MQIQITNLLGKEVIVYSALSYGIKGLLEEISDSQYYVEGTIDFIEFGENSISRIIDNKIYLLDHDLQWVDGLTNYENFGFVPRTIEETAEEPLV